MEIAQKKSPMHFKWMMPAGRVQTLQFDLTFTVIIEFEYVLIQFPKKALKCNGGCCAISNGTDIIIQRVKDSLDILMWEF